MARPPYSGVQEVSPDVQAPNDYQQANPTPASFGAPIAEGLQEAGQSALKVSDFYGQVAADNAVNNYIQKSTAILRGDPNSGPAVDANGIPVLGPGGAPVNKGGYFSLRGADAMSAFKETSEALDESLNETRDSLVSETAQKQFDNEARRYRAQYANEMGEHNDQQQQVWAINTNTNSIALTQNQIATHMNNPDALAQDQEALRQSYVKLDQSKFGSSDPAVTQGAVLKADQDFYLTQIRAAGDNGERAKAALDASGSVLASLPQYDGIVRQVNTAVFNQQKVPFVQSHIVSDLADAQRLVLNGAQGSAAAPGAVSPYNLGNVKAPAGGFAQPATPTDGVILTANNLRSGYQGLTIEQIAQKWAPVSDHNDPAQWAANVAHASGLAPNAVPNLNDPTVLASLVKGVGAAEKKGSDLAAFTPQIISQGVTASLAGQHPNLSASANGPTTYPSVSDALNATMTDRVDAFRNDAQQKWGAEHPEWVESATNDYERQLNRQVDQEKRQQEVNAHIVQSAMAGPNPPISEDQLMALGPQVASAWNALQFSNPYVRQGIENRFNVNAKGKALTFGTGFKDYFDRAMAPSSDPNRISDPTALNNYVGAGEDAPLTNTGSDQLTQLIGLRNTPQGEAFAAQSKAFVDQVHAELTFSNPTIGNVDPQGEKLFAKAMAYIAPKMVEAYKAGNLPQLLDPKNKDYLGAYATSLSRTPSQMLSDRLRERSFPTGGASAADTQALYATPAQAGQALIEEAVRAGRLSPQQAVQISREHGFPLPGARGAPAAKPARPAIPALAPPVAQTPGP